MEVGRRGVKGKGERGARCDRGSDDMIMAKRGRRLSMVFVGSEFKMKG